MRRTTRSMRALFGGLLLALLVVGSAGDGHGQDVKTIAKAVIVPLSQTVRLQMTTKKPISRVFSPKENVVAFRAVPGDPTTIILIGQAPDIIRLELTDEDGKKEIYEVIVQLDVEYLRSQLRRAVPTANITPIPFSNNGVILTGTVARAEDVDVIMRVAAAVGGLQIVNGLRVGGVQQVQLDVVIAQVSRNEFRALAFNFLTDSKNFFFGQTTGQAVANPATIGVGSTLNATLAGQALAGALGAPNGQADNILFGVLHNSYGFLGFLQALRNEGVSKTLAQPSLVTMSGTAGSFLAGGEQAVPVPAGLGQVGVQFEEFGTRLNYLPIVLGNGKIHLEVEPEVSSLNAAFGTVIAGATVPGRTTNRTHATVELEPGQTFVIAGLIQHDVQGSTQKLPILGDLPFLGTMFSTKSFSETEQEIVILVTPHLVDAQDCQQLTKCLPGQESRSPDDFELFLEGILEAHRGPRQVFQGGHYVPDFKNGPTSEIFPCAGGRCGAGRGTGCGTANGCGPNGCGASPAPAPAAMHSATMAPALAPAPRVIGMPHDAVTAPEVPTAPPPGVEPRSLPPVLPPAGESE